MCVRVGCFFEFVYVCECGNMSSRLTCNYFLYVCVSLCARVVVCFCVLEVKWLCMWLYVLVCLPLHLRLCVG